MNMRSLVWLAAVLCFVSLAAGQVKTPSVGFARYSDGSVRPVYGLPANFVVGKPILQGVNAASFSNAGGLAAMDGEIRLLDATGKTIATFASGEAHPLVNLDGDLTTAVAWLPSQNILVHWDGKAFVQIPVNATLTGTVTALHLAGNVVTLLLIENGELSRALISLDSGELRSLEPIGPTTGAAFLQGSLVLYQTTDGLQAGEGQALPVNAKDLQIERTSANWLHLSSASLKRDWALKIAGGGIQLSELPGARQ